MDTCHRLFFSGKSNSILNTLAHSIKRDSEENSLEKRNYTKIIPTCIYHVYILNPYIDAEKNISTYHLGEKTKIYT